MFNWEEGENRYSLYTKVGANIANIRMLKSFDSPETEHYDCSVFHSYDLFCLGSETPFEVHLRFDIGNRNWKVFQKVIEHIVSGYEETLDKVSLEEWTYHTNESGILAYLLLKGNRIGHIDYLLDKNCYHLEIPQDFTACRTTICKNFSPDLGSSDLKIKNNPETIQQMLHFAEHAFTPEVIIEKYSDMETIQLTEGRKNENQQL